jgi:hypothetical protein
VSVLITAFSPGVRAAQITLEPVKDNTLYEPRNAASFTSNGAGEHFFAGRVDDEGNAKLRRGLLAFDIAGNIPAGATITQVTLTLNVSRARQSGTESFSLHPLLLDWGEGASDAPSNEGEGTTPEAGDVTWNHTFYDTDFWTTPGGDFTPTASATQTVNGVGAYTWGSTPTLVSDVQTWLDAPAGNFGWLVRGNEAGVTTSKRFDSRENAILANRPMLTVAYVPEPTCALLLTWGGLILARRRNSTRVLPRNQPKS